MDCLAPLPPALVARLPQIFNLVIPHLDPPTLAAAARVNSDAFRLSTTLLWHTAPQYVLETVQPDSPFAPTYLNKVRVVDASRNNTTSLPLLPPLAKVEALRSRCPNITELNCTGSSQPPGFRLPSINITFEPSPSNPSPTSSGSRPAPTGSIRRRVLDHWYYICSPRALDLPCEESWPGFDMETEYGVAIYKPQDPAPIRRWLLDAENLDPRIYRLDVLQGVEASLAELGQVCAKRRKLGKRAIEEMQVSGGRGGDLRALLQGAGVHLRALIIDLEGQMESLLSILETVERCSPGLKSLSLTIRASPTPDTAQWNTEDEKEADKSVEDPVDAGRLAAPATPPQLEHLFIALPDMTIAPAQTDETVLQAIAGQIRRMTAPKCSVRLDSGCENGSTFQSRLAGMLGTA